MKLFTIKNSVVIVLISASIFACNNSTERKAEKVEDAKEDVIKATDALDKAREDSASDYLAYKEASEKQINKNNEKILELKAKIKEEKAELRNKNQEALAELDQKNAKLKQRMQDYKASDKASWEAFKLGFNQDMDALGKSLSAMAQKNMDKK
jgi:membrane-associated HD superfamily phosphohydrolase